MWFTKLELGDFILAPRPSYSITKIDYKPTTNGPGGACVGCGISPIKEWEIVYTIVCLGHGDLSAARILYNRLNQFLIDNVCNTTRQKLVLQYCDETPLEHDIYSAYIAPVDLDTPSDCCSNTNLSLELHMTGLDPVPDVVEPVLSNIVVVQI